MMETILIIIGIIALVINIYGFLKLLMADRGFLSLWYKIILKGIVVIVFSLQLFIIFDVVNDSIFYFIKNIDLYQRFNLVLFILALVTTFSLMAISIINIKIANEHGFK